MKKGILVVCILLFAWILPASAAEEAQGVAGILDSGEVESAARASKEAIDEEFSEYFGSFDFQDAVADMMRGGGKLDPQNIFTAALSLLLSEMRQNISLILKLCAVCILSVIILNLRDSVEDDGIGQIAFFAVYALCAGILLSLFGTAFQIMKDCTDKLQAFMNTMLGALMAVGMAGGNIVTSGAFYPVMTGVCSLMGTILNQLLIPILCFTSVLTIVNRLNDNFHARRLCEVANTCMKWILCFGFMLFVGVLTIKGVLGANLDALGAKGIKFAVSSFVPVVGGILSDAVETVAGSGQLIKNSLGTVGLIAVAAILIVPALKLAAMVLVLKLTSAILDCICDKRLSGAIWDMSGTISMALAFVVVYGVLFMVAIASFINATNSAFMMR